jgi:hypothetical protein
MPDLDDVAVLVDPTAADLEGALRPLLALAPDGGRLPNGWVAVASRLTGASTGDLVVAWSQLRD